MKYLETSKTCPHDKFIDLTDMFIKEYLYVEFEIVMEDISPIKDILNMYSYILECESPIYAFKSSKDIFLIDDYVLTIPDDMNILNAACAIFIKLTANKYIQRKYSSITFVTTDYEETEFIENLVNLNVVEEISIIDIRRMQEITDIILISTEKYFDNKFLNNVINKKYKVRNKYNIDSFVGYIYIDYSMSIYLNNLYLFKLFANSLPFNKENVILHIFSVTKAGINLLGVATNKAEFKSIVTTTTFSPGEIDITTVINHMQKYTGKITFVTDSDDFNISEFKKQVNNCNIITINGKGKIIKA